MKPQQKNTKLALNKKSIAKLDQQAMFSLGGNAASDISVVVTIDFTTFAPTLNTPTTTSFFPQSL